MTVYAPTPGFADHRPHPRALTAIILVHVVAIAAVMSAKMDLPTKVKRTITEVEFIDPPKPPPPPPPPETQPQPKQQPQQSVLDQAKPLVKIPVIDLPPVDNRDVPIPPFKGPIGPALDPVPQPDPIPLAEPVRVGPRFATPADDVRPPYPESKRAREEEASLRLRLSIGANGRVVAVEPVGQVDRAFFEAARRHILSHWRYKPATEDGRAVASTTVVTLKFELED
jgi:protein TonB